MGHSEHAKGVWHGVDMFARHGGSWTCWLHCARRFLLGRGLALLILDLAETKEPVEETADLDVGHVSDGGGDCDDWKMRRKQ